MTFSIVAKCPRTGNLGIAIATYTLAVGQYCDGLLSQIGATMSQASVRQVNNGIGLQLIAQGLSAEHVLHTLVGNDPFPSFRQIAVIDRHGRAACHTGADARNWKGHHARNGLVAMGNVLLGPEVVDGMVRGFDARPEDNLEDRLLKALEAGRDAGGQSNGSRRMPERSAALIVMSDQHYPKINLRVDLHDRAVDELRRVYDRYQLYADYYRQRDLQPATVPGQEVFEEAFNGQTFWQP
ncbi:MAG: DUF1028 domain-containing protein [Pseudomonadota bacterium]